MVRETAKICSVNDLLVGEYVVQEGWLPNYIKINDRKLSRVNIMGFVVEKPSPFRFLLDDGTGSISVNDFNNTKKTANLKVGDPVLVVGRPRKANEETFISCEIANPDQLKENPEWLKIRKQQLNNPEKIIEPKETLKEEIVPNQAINLTGDEIIDFVKKKDSGEGCSIESIIDYFGKEADDLIITLLSMGEVFEIKPGKIKVLE